MKCERCGKEHDGSFGSGRFCSKACANTRYITEEQRKKTRSSVKESHEKYFQKGCKCEKCGNIFHTKDYSRRFCFDCLPTTIKHTPGKKDPKSILDVSKRTTMKILKRMNLPCSCCSFHLDGIQLDIHHIVPKSKGGTDDMSNLTYICPNCHRIAHTNATLLQRPLVPITTQLEETEFNWKEFYYGSSVSGGATPSRPNLCRISSNG